MVEPIAPTGRILRLHKYILKNWSSRHHEIRWTAIGLLIGGIIGFFIGGVGIARAGGAVGVSGALLFGGIGAALGNRLGIGRDKKVAASNRSVG
jgi:hypothetical protein